MTGLFARQTATAPSAAKFFSAPTHTNVVVLNFSGDGTGTGADKPDIDADSSSDWIYPHQAATCIGMYWIVNSGDTSGPVYGQIRGETGGAGATQYAIYKDDAATSPSTEGHASTETSQVIGFIQSTMIPYEFRLYNASGSNAAEVTLYLVYDA